MHDDGGRSACDAYTFRFDGDTVTLRLRRAPGIWKSSDDFDRLSAQARNDALWYRPPFGDGSSSRRSKMTVSSTSAVA